MDKRGTNPDWEEKRNIIHSVNHNGGTWMDPKDASKLPERPVSVSPVHYLCKISYNWKLFVYIFSDTMPSKVRTTFLLPSTDIVCQSWSKYLFIGFSVALESVIKWLFFVYWHFNHIIILLAIELECLIDFIKGTACPGAFG